MSCKLNYSIRFQYDTGTGGVTHKKKKEQKAWYQRIVHIVPILTDPNKQ